jgi:predicted small secreted protein
MKTTLKTLMTVALLGTMFGLAACNTTKGLGKDVENAGEAVQDAAD